MITSLKNFTYESTGFDLLETENDNPSNTGLWFRKEAAEYEAKAKEYLAKKERVKYYAFSGHCEQLDSNKSYLFPLTDQEVARIRQLVVEINREKSLKANYKENEIPTTFEEACDDIEYLYYLEGDNAELDSLIFDPLTNLEFPMDLYTIDLEHPICLYEMSYVGYDWKWEKPIGPIIKRVQLTDEEYLYLVVYRLLYDRFTFNRLLFCRPELAQKICAQLDTSDDTILFEKGFPYLVVFEEINADAEKILEKEK